MVKRVLFAVFVSIVILGVFVLLKENPVKLAELDEENERAEDPEGRAFQEFLMLRDPVTNMVPENMFLKEREFVKKMPKAEGLILGKNGNFMKAQALTWINRGPNNVGGRTRGLAVDIRTSTPPNVIINAGGVSGGLWRSTDNGTSWTETTLPGQLHNVSCLVQDSRPGKQDIWYAGSGEYNGNSATQWSSSNFYGNGIFKSTDNGQSWNQILSTLAPNNSAYTSAFEFINNIALNPANPAQDEIYAAASNTIQRSTDGGNTWTVVRGHLSNNSATNVQVTSTGVVYAALNSTATDAGIWRSVDGTTWTNITSGVPGFPTQYGRIIIGIAPSNPSIVYFLIENTNSSPNVNNHQLWKYTYISGDGSGAGGSWENRSSNLPNETGLSGNAVFDTQGGYDMLINVSPVDPNFVLLGGVNLYRSTDGFATNSNWVRIGGYASPSTYSLYPNHHCDIHSGMFLPGSNSVYYSGNDGGIQRTDNVNASSVSWTSLNNGYNVTQFYSVSVDPEASSNILMGGTQDNGTWVGNSPVLSNWQQSLSGDGCYSEIAPLADNRIYPTTQNGSLYSEPRDFSTRTQINPSGGKNPLFVNPFTMDPNNSSILYYAEGNSLSNTGIWRNNNAPNATTTNGWTFLTSSSKPISISINGSNTYNFVSAIGVSKSNSANVVYYGTAAGKIYRIDNASIGASPTVTDVSTDIPGGGYVASIAVDPNNSNNVIAVLSNYNVKRIWYSANGGQNWTNQDGNIDQATGPSVRWVTMFYVAGVPHYFLATSAGVFYTNLLSGNSTIWNVEGSSSVGNVVCVMLDYRESDGLLAVATHGKGIYSTQISSPLPVEMTAFNIKANYGKSELFWTTVTEVNNYGWEVERKRKDDPAKAGWIKLGFVAGTGNSSSHKNYSFIDNSISTSGQYLYRLKQIDFDGKATYSPVLEVSLTRSSVFALNQNFPNPANPSTKISYEIPEDSRVTLKIYDAGGREVATLVDGIKSAGLYEAEFNGRNLASGIYLYRLDAGVYSKTMKMIIMK